MTVVIFLLQIFLLLGEPPALQGTQSRKTAVKHIHLLQDNLYTYAKSVHVHVRPYLDDRCPSAHTVPRFCPVSQPPLPLPLPLPPPPLSPLSPFFFGGGGGRGGRGGGGGSHRRRRRRPPEGGGRSPPPSGKCFFCAGPVMCSTW
jgi:hypothetical protein